MRITVKALGDHTRRLQELPVGTGVLIDGPYGDFTTASRTRDGALLIAAGIGITPIRALLEALPAGSGRTVLLYRARTAAEAVFAPSCPPSAGARTPR